MPSEGASVQKKKKQAEKSPQRPVGHAFFVPSHGSCPLLALPALPGNTTLAYTMKVLMFGWEFPPHISGGLGTACAGLTHALEKAEVEVIFVVPKLHGGEHAERTVFVEASAIPIRQQTTIPFASDPGTSLSDTLVHPASQQTKSTFSSLQTRTSVRGNQTLIEVSSLLSPYVPENKPALEIADWNYTLAPHEDRTVPADVQARQETRPQQKQKIRYVKRPYSFSGVYGPDLLEEVERYAQAGREIARRHTFDVIHAHDWMTYRAGIAAQRATGKPLVVHVHATEIDRSGAHVNPRVFEIEREGMLLADHVVTVSQWTKNIAMQHYGISPEKIEVIHNGILPRNEDKAPIESPPPLASPVVTFLGRITHQKGPMYFVEAARKVHEKFPDVHFVVAGSGDQLPAMIERIAQLRLSSRFHFTGFLRGEDIHRVWAMSSVYVMPSVSEPFGIAPLEAIQAGVPVVLSKQAGVSEVMPHAIKVDFWNTTELSEAICNVLRYKSLADSLRKNGAEEIKGITWDKAAKKLTTLYYDLTTQRKTKEKSHSLLSGSSAETSPHVKVLRHRKQQTIL